MEPAIENIDLASTSFDSYEGTVVDGQYEDADCNDHDAYFNS
jgi:hypothetical protein